ncbi:phosphotransferase family protein [Allokutzneria albata]|uniref:Phosphotransferase enzyme family protein n=1 Tax=Allokutzneria albata TaxID=211114 RepID=A0A1G9U581_ALLAB|nr:aminoglycoside phosphotransferase family protein [Allokutzneria albata]SDM54794.1 Phosphotransferase enzyme family protein [Allokutzneria albata]
MAAEISAEVDSWAPAVQGAVGHVVGLRGLDGDEYVLKLYPSWARHKAAVEVRALQLTKAEIRVPRVLGTGEWGEVSYVVMSRVPGVRWADRRRALSPSQSRNLHRAVGTIMRRMHGVRGEWFGDVLPEGPRWSRLRERMAARRAELVERYEAVGGPAAVARRVRGLELSFDARPVLCHNDFIDGNILVAEVGEPRVLGVIDFEKASFDDPIADLARTVLHAEHHDPAAADELVAAYGQADRRRLAAHRALHLLDERIWISTDRPAGWEESVERLDALLVDAGS